jgi:Mycothiol maleylpyruvate isomerase N-terminal domain
VASDPTWDFRNPASKARLLGVLQREVDEMFDLAAEPARWHAPTACPGWELRDMIGHLVAETEGYVSAFDRARRGAGVAKEPVGVAGMAQAADEAARRCGMCRVTNCSIASATRPTS